MVAVPFGQNREACAVQAYAAVMDVVGILTGPNPACAEPDLTRLRIDAVDASDHPRSAGDLGFDLAGPGVIEVKVIPAVALGHPDDLARIVEQLEIELARVINERGTLLVDDGLGLASLRIDGDDPEHLMPALVV